MCCISVLRIYGQVVDKVIRLSTAATLVNKHLYRHTGLQYEKLSRRLILAVVIVRLCGISRRLDAIPDTPALLMT